MDAINEYLRVNGISWTTIGIIVAILVVFLFLRLIPMALKGGVPFVQPSYVQKRRESEEEHLIIDVRPPEEFDQGHIPGSINIPLAEIPAKVDALPEEELDHLHQVQIFMTCKSGARGMAAAKFFKKKGFQRVAVIAGGCNFWQKQGLEYSVDQKPDNDQAAS